ncbi:MAG: phosphate-selective porin O and P [Woeseiaceae bacterium]
MTKQYKPQSILGGSVLLALLALSTNAFAANWLLVQGTEPQGAEQLAKVWGFVQVQYQDDSSKPNDAGGYIPPKLIGPNLDTQSSFNVNRARIGVRGVAMPLDQKINYFLLLEMGNNGITEPEGSFAKATDASITFNHLDGMRVRAGLFKYPGSEEGLQAIHVFDYINFTWVTQQMLLERFPNRNFTPNNPAQPLPPEIRLNGYERGVGAFRDVGVQLFDAFNVGADWELSYALMVGNGNGLNFTDNDDNKDTYIYASAEKVFGGTGPRREGLKFFAWSHQGKRTADLSADSCANDALTFPACGPAGSGRISTDFNPEEYDRDRMGFGAKYLRNGLRLTAEYMEGEGMIWQAPHNPSFALGPGQGIPTSERGNGAFAEGKGFYVEGGYRFKNSGWEIDLRYDEYNRLDGNEFQIDFDRTTIGVQYFFNPRVRIAVNYEMRSGNAPEFDPGAGPNAQVDGIDDRLAIQVTGIWSQ